MEHITWTKCLDKEYPALSRAGCTSVTYKDRYAFIIGGRQRENFYLDCWSFDTQTGALNSYSKGPSNGNPRAHHSATLIGEVVWIIGGSDDKAIRSDDAVWCFNLRTKEWKQPKLEGDLLLLRRTAHGACLHPTLPGSILLFGGYGQIVQSNTSSPADWLADLVLVDTINNKVQAVTTTGRVPSPRAYHSFTAVGNLCISLFGRAAGSSLVPHRQAVIIFDAKAGKWVATPKIKGTTPAVRSSHRVNASKGGLFLFGGAPSGPKKDRLSDLHFLRVSTSDMEWTSLDSGQDDDAYRGAGEESRELPSGRAAHAQELINRKLYLFGGYGSNKSYCGDAWEGQIGQNNTNNSKSTTPLAGVTSGAAAVAAIDAIDKDTPVAGSSKWRSSRRALENNNTLPEPKRARLSMKSQGGGVLPPLPGAAGLSSAAVGTKEIVAWAAKNNKNATPAIVIGCTEAVAASGYHPAMPAAKVAALERELCDVREALVAQRAREAALLRDSNAAQDEVHKLKDELRNTDESWRAAAKDRDMWKQRFEAAEKRVFTAEGQVRESACQVATAQEKARDALRQRAATSAAAEQQSKALDAAAAENTRLKSQAAALQRALDEAQQAADKERNVRATLQEQNTLLQSKITEALSEKGRVQGELQSVRTALLNAQRELEIEMARLQREISTAKASAAALQRDLDASKQRGVSLDAEIESLKQNAARQTSRIQRLEEEKRCAEEVKEQAEREVSKLRDDKQRMLREYDAQRRQLESELSVITSAVQRMNASGSRTPGH